MTREELLQDLAYARTLAEEGRRAPLIGGAYLVLFGVLLTICYAAQFLVLTSPSIEPSWAGAIWMGFGLAASVGAYALRKRTKALPGVASLTNKADRAVWRGVAFAILVVVIATVARAIQFDDFTAPNAIMAAGFGLYGVALYSTATLGDHAWLRVVAWLAWAISAVLWFFMHQDWAYLIAAAGAVLVLLIPGLAMMRAEPSKVV